MSDVSVLCFVSSAAAQAPLKQLAVFDRVRGLGPGQTVSLSLSRSQDGVSRGAAAGDTVLPAVLPGAVAGDAVLPGVLAAFASNTLSHHILSPCPPPRLAPA